MIRLTCTYKTKYYEASRGLAEVLLPDLQHPFAMKLQDYVVLCSGSVEFLRLLHLCFVLSLSSDLASPERDIPRSDPWKGVRLHQLLQLGCELAGHVYLLEFHW